MKSTMTLLSFAAAAALAPIALAGPTGKGLEPLGRRQVTPPGGGVQADGFEDTFDSYKAGSNISGQGGWEIWYLGGKDATVSDEQARSDPNSLKDVTDSDIVHRFAIDEGVWELSVYTYMPSDSGGEGFIIMMNQYENPGDSWSLQIRFDAFSGVVESQWDLAQLPLVTDQWVQFRAVIDLDNDTWDSFYNDQPLATDLIWTDNAFNNPVEAITSIACIDLYTYTASTFYYDNVSLQPVQGGCYPDFDGNGLLDLFDFLGFQNAFVGKDPKADCEANGIFDLFDFLCYQNAFVKGC